MFSCVKCDKQYNQHRNLRRHVRQVHEENTVLPSLKEPPLEWFLCSYCPRKYRTKRLLTLHITKEHDRPTTTDSKFICPLHCGFNSLRRNDLPNHLKDSHNVNVETESLQFTNYKFFLDWKEKLENDTKSRFVVSRSRGKAQLVTTHYFSCHRSGHFVSESKGLRHLKIKGSNKINAICPANIKVKENSNGECEVIFTKTHVGHKEDLGSLFLRTEERDAIATKIAAKIPYDAILNELRDNIDGTLDRVHLVTRKDLHNIETLYNLTGSGKRHQDDGISVHAWVEEMKNADDSCILFYKPQGSLNGTHNFLKKEDFILIIMNKGQEEILKKFGQNIICMDGTHGLNNYDFELITVLTVDELHQGFPCAFMFSNRTDESVIKIMIEEIRERIGIVKPEVFMSDMAESFFNGWSLVMGNPHKRLYCTWHVMRAWRHNLRDRIKNPEKREATNQLITALMQETDEKTFNALKTKVLNRMMADEETKEFGKYFCEYYIKCEKSWAFCYRLWAHINTNMHLEALHKTLKYFYLAGIKVKRLDKGIQAIMHFIRDKLFDRLITNEKGKLTSKLKVLRSRHKTSLKMTRESVVEFSPHNFIVPSETDPTELYTVNKVENSACVKCPLTCTECLSCIHEYTCTCVDNSIKWNMCKHIHIVCTSILQCKISTGSSGVVPDSDHPCKASDQCLIIDEEFLSAQNESQILIDQLSKKDNSKSDLSLELRKTKVLKNVQELLESATSLSDMDTVDAIVAKIKPTLTAKNSEIGIFSKAQKNRPIPANKKVTVQRNLFSTKRKSKNCVKSKNNVDEKKKMVLSLLIEGKENYE